MDGLRLLVTVDEKEDAGSAKGNRMLVISLHPFASPHPLPGYVTR